MTQSTNPIRSQLANDPDMAELIDLYLSELTGRLESLQTFWSSRQFTEIQRLAHQLRGASAGYGFPTIGEAAGKLEDQIRGKTPEQIQAEQVESEVRGLVDLCNRAIAGKS